ncbi:rod shape-determining protein RodA [Maribellus sp. YY47]|uniref:rod shape-determining protein RodA n=1 Tax=Maribellus sp. YY47 TaxID=2929486 RepID=UPI002001C6C8|nr:rod shape-determining protein RodA [Maribellus sp. YY47]MCK3686272.1 rod shape-determining protein RodA [Maribellus sp. YY47]
MIQRNNIWSNIDWITVLLYLVLVFMGWFNIYAAVYDTDHQSIFDISQRYGKQLLWIGAGVALAIIIMSIETNFYVFFSYAIYGVMVSLLLLVLLIANEVNGARSWLEIGGFKLQPSEFAKFATALALARYMSTFDFKLKNFKSLAIMALIIFTPAALILLQNDTGSALVYFSFVLVLFREGLSGLVLFLGTLVATLFILALILSKLTLILVLLGAAALIYLILNPKFSQYFKILVFFATGILLSFLLNAILGKKYELGDIIIFGSILGSLVTLVYSLIKKFKNYAIISLFFLGSVLFSISVDYTFNNILESHHQVRIKELLGLESNPYGAGYHVNQSKIAIGSGGMWGKGYLNGTQTKFNFVPEQSTDFIFCTVGEEWGFAGTFVVIALFVFFLSRLVWLAERQRSVFSRIYGYSVAIILFFHFVVNIGMTIGIMPVIGIPLPFFSYGGSSLWSFTILLFIFIRLDASRLENFRDSRNT